MVTFPVDDVTPVTDVLPTRPMSDLFPGALAAGGDARVLKPNGVHPLLHAVGKAFAEHRPLVLSPDAVWLTITRGVAQHVRLHAEELRSVLVRHQGKDLLEVQVFPGSHSWAEVVEHLAKQVGDTFFECDFSTSTDVERLAGRVAMLDAYSPYFGYWMIGICGIPSITLTGTPADWREIRTRIDDLPRFGLEHWCRSLVPITDHLVLAAEGNPDTAFWQRIYNPIDAYGGDRVTGWITRLYPYLELGSEGTKPNHMLDLPIDEPRDLTHDGWYSGPAITTDTVPATLCRAVINVNDRRDISRVAVDAGLAGVTQHQDGALEPVAGWAVVPAPPSIESVLDCVVAEHEWTPPLSPLEKARARFADLDPEELEDLENGEISFLDAPQGSGELIALRQRIGTASLHGGAWRLQASGGNSASIGRFHVDVVFDLADGRLVGEVGDFRTGLSHWVIFRDGDLPQDVPVLGTSLAMLLESVLDHNDVTHLETMRLDRLEMSYDD
ncbi:DUF4419 domain-containing protein [Lentzea sp. NEAU-D13]|uniref:DUF4419 domain-containing protein n=1 Tax=Lentzea alba TaxID=2714351 RepID=A0A7C9RRS9_9PSEU|nr:DUF4419 domain-containing protein [Lentzea alba]NGY60483.1 DUF4419 domain-containing protein [Lentzea alba]